ncbi:MAG TPA: hypothetical protein VKE22_18350 [Haliangiales bacterium]|nr:hypothetical protein [Haliangiales bacterium]
MHGPQLGPSALVGPLCAALALAVVAPSPALACSVCGCGDARESVTQMTLRPVIVYSPIEELNLVLQVPVVLKDWQLASPVAATSATRAGLGDIDVGARWFFWRLTSFESQSRQALGLSAGIALPTGPIGASEDGVRLDDHAQVGTGGFAPYVGASYAFHQDPWNLFVSLTGRLRTRNSYGYRYGDALTWSVRADVRVVDPLALELALDGRYAAFDTVDGQDQANTGGLVLAASPGLAVNVAGDVWLHARVQIPFATSLHGDQSVGPIYLAGVQVLVR